MAVVEVGSRVENVCYPGGTRGVVLEIRVDGKPVVRWDRNEATDTPVVSVMVSSGWLRSVSWTSGEAAEVFLNVAKGEIDKAEKSGTCQMLSSAILCSNDASLLIERKNFSSSRKRSLRSLEYSVGRSSRLWDALTKIDSEISSQEIEGDGGASVQKI